MIVIVAASVEEMAAKLQKFEPWDAKDEASLRASCAYAAEKVFPTLAKVRNALDARRAMLNAKSHRTDWLVTHGCHSDPRYSKTA